MKEAGPITPFSKYFSKIICVHLLDTFQIPSRLHSDTKKTHTKFQLPRLHKKLISNIGGGWRCHCLSGRLPLLICSCCTIMPLRGPTCKIARFEAQLKFTSWTECGNKHFIKKVDIFICMLLFLPMTTISTHTALLIFGPKIVKYLRILLW